MGKIAFISELPFNGKVDRNHPHMRTEFAQFCALQADHYCFYDIDDIKTSKNLNRMQADEIKHLDTLAQSYLNILNSRKDLNNA